MGVPADGRRDARPARLPAARPSQAAGAQGAARAAHPHPGARVDSRTARRGAIAPRRALGVGHGDRRRGHAPVHQHAGRTQDPFPDRHAGRFEGGGRGQDRPHMGQRQRVRAPPAGRRVDGHAGLLRGPVQLVPAGQQRESQRHDPPLPAQGHEPGRPGLGRARRDHPADQQHAPEGSRMAHAGGGVG